jgi:CelD/BcsL family acetyltransferase involved in cellulose biosynthesis
VAEQGHRLLDMGQGEEEYKQVFGNSRIPLAEGAFTRSTAAASLTMGAYSAYRAYRAYGAARRLVESPVGRWFKPVAQRARSL